MKQIKFNSGGQPFFNSDFALQQAEIYKAIEHQFLDTNGLVLSGCVVTGNSISAGLVYLDGKIRELASATGLTFPCYIKSSPQIDYDSRVHTEDNQNKTTKSEFKAEITNTLPVSGDYITVTASGVNKRLQYVLKNDQNGQFTPDAFALNAGKVSYVRASTSYILNLGTSATVFTNYSEASDDLNEFDAISGEFVAAKAGIYLVAGCVRIDYPSDTNNSAEILVEKFSGSWVTEANYLQASASVTFQSVFALSVAVKLNLGEKIRVAARRFGVSTPVNTKIELLNITRIA
ncbi:hypothetical protein [Raineya sp.]